MAPIISNASQCFLKMLLKVRFLIITCQAQRSQQSDQLVIMSVNPGFGGQKFIEYTYQKIEHTRNLIEKSGSKARIEVDGGVNLLNAEKLIDLGADILVAGTSIFGSSNPVKTIDTFKAL